MSWSSSQSMRTGWNPAVSHGCSPRLRRCRDSLASECRLSSSLVHHCKVPLGPLQCVEPDSIHTLCCTGSSSSVASVETSLPKVRKGWSYLRVSSRSFRSSLDFHLRLLSTPFSWLQRIRFQFILGCLMDRKDDLCQEHGHNYPTAFKINLRLREHDHNN